MNRVAKVLQWAVVAILLILLIEFPHGSITQHAVLNRQPIQTFTWAALLNNLGHLGHGIVTFSVGKTAINGYSVSQIVMESAGRSIAFIAIALFFVLVVGVWKGIYDGVHADYRSKGTAASAVIQWVLESVPDFFVIVTLETICFVIEIAIQRQIPFIGSGQFIPGTLIPAITLALVPTMYMARAVRTTVEEQFGQLYLITARAKGLSSRQVLIQHLIPNCLSTIRVRIIPVLAMMFSGLIMVEYLYYQHGLLFGLFSAMGNSGASPVFDHPIVHNGTIYSLFSIFDANLVIGYVMACLVVFVLFYGIVMILLQMAGYRRVRNPYTSILRDARRQGGLDWQLWPGIVMLGLLLVAAVFANHLGLPDPNKMDAIHFSGRTMSTPPFPPSGLHLLGTDEFGHDMFSGALHDTLSTFYYVGLATVGVLVIGTGLAILSSVAGWRPIRFLINTWNSCVSLIPGVVGALLILELPPLYWLGVHVEANGSSYWGSIHTLLYMVVIALIETGKVAYIVQHVLDEALEKEYMDAALISGNTRWTQFLLHLWRPLVETTMEQLFVEFNRIVILVAVVGFFQITLGQAWIPSQAGYVFVNTSHDWGGLFADTAKQFFASPWVLMAPALFVAWTVFAMNLVLESVRRRLRSVPSHPRGITKSMSYWWLEKSSKAPVGTSVKSVQ